MLNGKLLKIKDCVQKSMYASHMDFLPIFYSFQGSFFSAISIHSSTKETHPSEVNIK